MKQINNAHELPANTTRGKSIQIGNFLSSQKENSQRMEGGMALLSLGRVGKAKLCFVGC